MSKALMIGLGVAGVAVAGGVGYMLLRKKPAATTTTSLSVDPNRQIPGMPPVDPNRTPPPQYQQQQAPPPPPPPQRLAPPPPLPGYLSTYVTPAGEPLFRRPDGLLVKLSGVAFGTGPDNLVKNPQGQLVYLKDGLEINPALQGFMVAAPPPPPPDADLLADAAAKLEEAKRRAEEEARKLLNKKIEISFSGNRWSGPGRDHMGNHR